MYSFVRKMTNLPSAHLFSFEGTKYEPFCMNTDNFYTVEQTPIYKNNYCYIVNAIQIAVGLDNSLYGNFILLLKLFSL